MSTDACSSFLQLLKLHGNFWPCTTDTSTHSQFLHLYICLKRIQNNHNTQLNQIMKINKEKELQEYEKSGKVLHLKNKNHSLLKQTVLIKN